jgi:hypothetical protein
LAGAFKDAINLISVPEYLPTTVRNLEYCFYGATSFNDNNISSWDISNVIDISFIFYNTLNFNQNVYNWDVSSLNNHKFPFYGAIKYKQPLSGWLLNKILNIQDR